MDAERFASKLKRDGDCLLWQGARGSGGHGSLAFYRGGKRENWKAHRYAWFLVYGHIPEGALVIHSCRNRHCVAIEHLSLGDYMQNNGPDKRRDGTWRASAWNASATHCKHGHEFSPKNTHIRTNGTYRYCRACGRDRANNWYQQLKSCGVVFGALAHYSAR